MFQYFLWIAEYFFSETLHGAFRDCLSGCKHIKKISHLSFSQGAILVYFYPFLWVFLCSSIFWEPLHKFSWYYFDGHCNKKNVSFCLGQKVIFEPNLSYLSISWGLFTIFSLNFDVVGITPIVTTLKKKFIFCSPLLGTILGYFLAYFLRNIIFSWTFGQTFLLLLLWSLH